MLICHVSRVHTIRVRQASYLIKEAFLRLIAHIKYILGSFFLFFRSHKIRLFIWWSVSQSHPIKVTMQTINQRFSCSLISPLCPPAFPFLEDFKGKVLMEALLKSAGAAITSATVYVLMFANCQNNKARA